MGVWAVIPYVILAIELAITAYDFYKTHFSENPSTPPPPTRPRTQDPYSIGTLDTFIDSLLYQRLSFDFCDLRMKKSACRSVKESPTFAMSSSEGYLCPRSGSCVHVRTASETEKLGDFINLLITKGAHEWAYNYYGDVLEIASIYARNTVSGLFLPKDPNTIREPKSGVIVSVTRKKHPRLNRRKKIILNYEKKDEPPTERVGHSWFLKPLAYSRYILFFLVTASQLYLLWVYLRSPSHRGTLMKILLLLVSLLYAITVAHGVTMVAGSFPKDKFIWLAIDFTVLLLLTSFTVYEIFKIKKDLAQEGLKDTPNEEPPALPSK